MGRTLGLEGSDMRAMGVLGWLLVFWTVSCQNDQECRQWNSDVGASLSVSTFGACGDSGQRTVRCKHLENGWECSCVVNGIEVRRFTHAGGIPGSVGEAEKFANGACSWQLSH